MKALWISVGAVVVLAVGVLGYFYLRNSDEATRQNAEIVAQKTESKPDTSAKPTSTAKGVYADYSKESFDRAKGTHVLFFHAPWCPQCRALDESIKAATVPDGVTIFKIDYDSNQELRQKYGVTLQTTLVKVDSNGESSDKYVAYNEPTYDAVKQNLLD